MRRPSKIPPALAFRALLRTVQAVGYAVRGGRSSSPSPKRQREVYAAVGCVSDAPTWSRNALTKTPGTILIALVLYLPATAVAVDGITDVSFRGIFE